MKLLYFVSIIFTIITTKLFAQTNIWTQKANVTNVQRVAAIGFSTTQYGYVCMGAGTNNFLNDVLQYNPVNDNWIQKNTVTMQPRAGGFGYTVGNFCYTGFGIDDLDQLHAELWQYDPANDSWSQRANFPSSPRTFSSGFVLGNYFYIACGILDNTVTAFANDCWQYDVINNTWTQKAFFPGIPRGYCVSFAINSNGYMGCGFDSANDFLNDFYKFDPTLNSWTQLNNLPVERGAGVSFVLNNINYIGLGANNFGALNDLWAYNSINDSWVQVASLPAVGRDGAIAFTIQNKAYVGTGEDDNTDYLNDFWEYTPDPNLFNRIDKIDEKFIDVYLYNEVLRVNINSEVNQSIFISLYDAEGKMIIHEKILSMNSNIDCSFIKSGIYFYRIEDNQNRLLKTGKVIRL